MNTLYYKLISRAMNKKWAIRQPTSPNHIPTIVHLVSCLTTNLRDTITQSGSSNFPSFNVKNAKLSEAISVTLPSSSVLILCMYFTPVGLTTCILHFANKDTFSSLKQSFQMRHHSWKKLSGSQISAVQDVSVTVCLTTVDSSRTKLMQDCWSTPEY